MANVWKFSFHNRLPGCCEFRILLMVKIFKAMSNLKVIIMCLACFGEETFRVNVLPKQPISFRWFLNSRRSKAEMEFSVSGYKQALTYA